MSAGLAGDDELMVVAESVDAVPVADVGQCGQYLRSQHVGADEKQVRLVPEHGDLDVDQYMECPDGLDAKDDEALLLLQSI